MVLNRQYSKEDLKKAVETAEMRGLDHFLKQNPQDTHRSVTSSEDMKTDTFSSHQTVKNHFFDNLMFGPRNSKRNKEPLTSSAPITTNKKDTGHYTLDVDTHLKRDEELITCDPCQEVREIVEGIKAGEYKLRRLETSKEVAHTRKSYAKRGKLRLPSHWHPVSRSQSSFSTQNDDDQMVSWVNGNMQAVRILVPNE